MAELLSPEIEQETIATVGVAVFKGTYVLLVQHNAESEHINSVYGLPAGRQDTGEDMPTAAARELEEETGLIVNKDDLVTDSTKVYFANIERKDGKIKKFSLHVFVALKTRGELKATNESTPEWVLISKLDEYNLLPNVKQAILDSQQLLRKELKYDRLRNTLA